MVIFQGSFSLPNGNIGKYMGNVRKYGETFQHIVKNGFNLPFPPSYTGKSPLIGAGCMAQKPTVASNTKATQSVVTYGDSHCSGN